MAHEVPSLDGVAHLLLCAKAHAQAEGVVGILQDPEHPAKILRPPMQLLSGACYGLYRFFVGMSKMKPKQNYVGKFRAGPKMTTNSIVWYTWSI